MTKKKRTLTDEELDELLYEVIRFLKDWCLWESVSICCAPAGKQFISYAEEDLDTPQGLREIPDVWISEYCETHCAPEYLGGGKDQTMVIMCEGETPLNNLLNGNYSAEFSELSGDAQQFILQHEELLGDWYEWYREEPQLDETEFDSYEEYRELEDERQDTFIKEQIEAFLRDTGSDSYDGEEFRERLAGLISQKFYGLLDKYHQNHWCDWSIGKIVVFPRTIEG